MVGVLESPAGGKAMGDPCDGDAEGSEDIGEVVSGGLAFDIGAERKDDFTGVFLADALDKRIDAELGGADMIERSEASAEGMVKAAKDSAALEWKDVGGLFDDAEFASLAIGV